MLKTRFMLALLLLALPFGLAQARDTRLQLSIEDAMNTPAAKEKLDGSVKFYFSGQNHPKVKTKLEEDATNKKTNAFNKTDQEACEWTFLSAMIQLQDKAKQIGADAVLNIHSYYKRVPFKSATEYECHAGAFVAGVALKGEFVQLDK